MKDLTMFKAELQRQMIRIEPLGPPRGEVEVWGAKNCALPLIAAALLVEEGITTIHQVPPVEDVRVFLEIITGLGAMVEADWRHQTIRIDASDLNSDAPDPILTGQLRGSLMLMAPLLIRLGSFQIARPGGCAIGARKVDLHVAGLQAMGAAIRTDGPIVEARCSLLRGCPILLDMPSHTATQQFILAAVRAEGVTIISNASQEPEVQCLCRALAAMGAQISGIGGSQLTITGVGRLHVKVLRCLPSRLETSFFAMTGCLPGGRLTIWNAAPEAAPVLHKLREMGAQLHTDARGCLHVTAPPWLRGTKAVTWPYPGFPTDAQPHLLALACHAHGQSVVRETMFESRFQHVGELNRMGAEILLRQQEAIVSGPRRLVGTQVTATDIQAGAGLVLAALAAEGPTTIQGFQHIRRGYPELLPRLEGLRQGCNATLLAG